MTLLVQTDRIVQNFENIQKIVVKTPIIPVLEANAEGNGDVAVARLLADMGIRTMAVSRLDEAVRISEAVRGLDIMVMTPYSSQEDIKTILENDLIASVGSEDVAVLLSSLSKSMNRRARIQLCFDFGMGHFGYSQQDAQKAAQTVKHLENIELFGVYTVLPSNKKMGKKRQEEVIKQFNRVISTVERQGLSIGVTHMAGIEQFLDNPKMRFGAVRVGGDLFGRGPLKEKFGLKKVGRVVSEICDLKWLTAGKTIGDDGKYKIKKATRIAVIPAGAGDGIDIKEKRFLFFRRKRWCEINGEKAEIIGKIGLAVLTVDTTDIECAVRDIIYFDVPPVNVSALVKREYV